LRVAGGPDCLVRLWNVFVTNKAVCVFRGHHACLVACVIQADTQRVISLSKDRCVKVWDIAFQVRSKGRLRDLCRKFRFLRGLFTIFPIYLTFYNLLLE
jgi:WD40 repeat protein